MMDASQLIRSHLASIETYEPADSSEVLAQQGDVPLEKVIRLNANENPYGPSPRVREALANSDPMALFISDRCLVSPESRTIASGLYSEYVDWCLETERAALGQRSFGMQLTKLGFTRRRRGRGRHWWDGIELSAPAA